MKKTIFLFIFLLSAISVFAFEGKWVFNNIFSQAVHEGSAPLVPMGVSILKSIEFGSYEDNNPHTMTIRTGTIEMLYGKDEIYKTFNCSIFESDSGTTSVIALRISAPKEIVLTIFVAKLSGNRLWYSFAISPEAIQHGEVKGATKNDAVFQNMIGIMVRAQ
ncbi:MAG: hypothetical protein LBQ57_01635 [Spirochaetales bacterium]|jgi:hypothetical protein|nr:hypothetical protein [Spirochaetales bacterium]